MVLMVDPDGDVVDVEDHLYDYMLARRYLPYMGDIPNTPQPNPESPLPEQGAIARYDQAARRYLPSSFSELVSDVVGSDELEALVANSVANIDVPNLTTILENGLV